MSNEVSDLIRELIKRQTQQKWLINFDSEQFKSLFERYDRDFSQLAPTLAPPRILLAHSDPWHYLAALLAAIAHDFPVFLANPQWQGREWQQVRDLVNPNEIVGHILLFSDLGRSQAQNMILPDHAVMIATGGSSGQLRFAIHSWQTLLASVQGFWDYFEVDRVNSCCVLPIYHVSGLMQFLRSFIGGGKFLLCDYKSVPDNLPDDLHLADWFISLVPTQLQSLLTQNSEWLAQFGTVLLGGAPPWESLLKTARSHQIKLALTYGMTETASQIATLKPKDFIGGDRSNGRVLPHAQIQILDQQGQQVTSHSQAGIIAIQAQSQFWGYYPQVVGDRTPLVTDDIGYLDQDGYLHILGRSSQKIITGGENVYPCEVESALMATHLLQDVAVVGVEDETWGQAIAAIYVPLSRLLTADCLKSKLKKQVSGYKIPKYWLIVPSLPRNAQGKLAYLQLHQWAKQQIMASAANQPQNSPQKD